MKMTPLMEQYFSIRQSYPDCLLFFQVGDFYELFFEHAQQAAPILGIVLTSRGQHDSKPVPLCGVPMHALNHYLSKLIKAGFHVAICNQLEEAKPGVVVKRGVTQVLTPATLTDMRLLDEKRSSYLCVSVIAHDTVALVFAEILTGQLYATVLKCDDKRAIQMQLSRFMPDEIIVDALDAKTSWQDFFKQQGFSISEPIPLLSAAFEQWFSHFSEPLGAYIKRVPVLLQAVELLYAYLEKNQPSSLVQLKTIVLYKPDDFLVLDATTQKNLELISNTIDGSAHHTLFSVLDKAVTPMGSRMIKRWILSPLVNAVHINARLDAVQLLVREIGITQQLVEQLAIGDFERVVGRTALERAHLHDYVRLTHVLTRVPIIAGLVQQLQSVALLERIAAAFVDFSALQQLLAAALNDDTTKDWLIKPGFDHYLDSLRAVLDQTHERVVALETREQEKTGISSLKIRYNNVQGYYIEITKSHLHLVPDYYERQQTLVGKERFMIHELLDLERQLLKARSEIDSVEQEVFQRLKKEVVEQLAVLRQLSYALATLDALVGFALVAYDNNYCRPEIHDKAEIIIINGKHPVVAQALVQDFIANDTQLGIDARFWLITGPNMGGKSTYLRQVALICLMAQCGSFVPASAVALPIIDRIFTRVGAGDNLAGGKSTFLVEMEETAAICQQATEKSLVILDEVGRGTSTYDGLAIAQAVAEYLHQKIRCYCLFATHYHELTVLEEQLPGIVNYHAASKQQQTGVLFLHKIMRGAAQGSFGIEVAQLAQLPPEVIKRAREVLQIVDRQNNRERGLSQVPACTSPRLSDDSGKVLRQVLQLDLDNLTPKQALDTLWELKKQIHSFYPSSP